MKEITVAVVGAGAGGLAALRVLNHNPADAETTFKVTAFEQTSGIGGTWFYTECVGTDELGLPVHSSMYKNLRANIPKEVMGYPDYPIPPHLPSYVTHEDMYTYLQDYATHFDLWKRIKFRTIVEHIRPLLDKNKQFGVKWEVITADVTNREVKQTSTFDAVLVCNGQFAKPYMPEVPGLDVFQGHVIHSHNYRRPDTFRDKTVVVLGAQHSGLDISHDVAAIVTRVYLSHNKPKLRTILHPKVEQKPGIKRCRERTVEFNDGSQVEADAIIICTGYLHDFRFLDDSIGIKVEEERITPLYKHFLSVDYPSLGLIGIVKGIIVLPLLHFQAVCFRSILDGSSILPSREEMLKDEEESYHQTTTSQGKPPRFAHFIIAGQFKYMRELAEWGHDRSLPRVFETIADVFLEMKAKDYTNYRDFNFLLSEDQKDFKVVSS